MATLVLVLALLAAAAPAQPVLAGGTFTVNITADTHDATPGDTFCVDSGGKCSLRAAIEEATAQGGATTINLPPGTYVLTLGELQMGTLAGTNITLNGAASPVNTIIQQNDGVNRVFNIDSAFAGNVTVTIQNVTITGGVGGAGGGGGAVLDGDPGDALTVTNVVFSNNRTSSFNGGAISFTGGGTLTVANSTFNGNQSPTGNGGAIHFLQTAAGSLTVTDSTFTGNLATGGTLGGQGGAVNAGCAAPCTAVTIIGSTFTGNSAVQVASSGGQGGALMIGAGNATLAYNRIVGNTASGGGNGIYHGGGNAVNAINNWWGCNGGPGGVGCDTAVNAAGTLATAPYIVLSNTSNPTAVALNQTTTLTASFQQNSAAAPLAAANLAALGGLPVTWGSATRGVLSATQATTAMSGSATATATAVFTANAAGAGSASATVDHATVAAGIMVNKAGTTTAITSDLPDPSLTGQAVTVHYTVVSATGSTPTAPAGNVTVSDGTDSCIGTVAAGSCSLALTISGPRTLTATYGGDANFSGSTSAGTGHLVLWPSLWLPYLSR